VDTTVSADHVADLPDRQAIGRILKCLLHLPGFEPAEIAPIPVGGTVRVLSCEFSEFISGPLDLCLICAENFDSLLFCASDISLQLTWMIVSVSEERGATDLFPAGRFAAVFMLHQQMTCPHLAGPTTRNESLSEVLCGSG
jgi:hypothetical protein